MTAGRIVLAPCLVIPSLMASVSAMVIAPHAALLDTEPLGGRETSFNGSHWLLRSGANQRRIEPKPKPWLPSPLCPAPEGAESWSMKQEDQYFYNTYFCGKRGGTFVEMGALDGVRFSNTKFFEDTMGWSGALIEASPDSSKLLQKNRGASKGNSIFGEAVCEKGVNHLDFQVSHESATNSVAGAMPRNWVEHYTQNNFTVVQVPCRPLGELLRSMMKKKGASHIDFFSLDVEGGELEVLKTMDWSLNVGVWFIEWGGGRPWKKEELTQLLTSHGYVPSPKGGEIDNNAIFVRP